MIIKPIERGSFLRVKGTDNKGQIVFVVEYSDKPYSLDEINSHLKNLHLEWPEAICFECQISFPDMDFVAMQN